VGEGGGGESGGGGGGGGGRGRGRAVPWREPQGVEMHPFQGYLAHTKLPPPWDHRRALCIGLLEVPRRRPFLMNEVPLHQKSHAATNLIYDHFK